MNNAIAALHIGTNNSGLEIFPFNYGVSAAIYLVHFFYEFESGGSTEHCYRTFFGHFDQLGSGQTFTNLQVTFQNCLSLKWEKIDWTWENKMENGYIYLFESLKTESTNLLCFCHSYWDIWPKRSAHILNLKCWTSIIYPVWILACLWLWSTIISKLGCRIKIF